MIQSFKIRSGLGTSLCAVLALLAATPQAVLAQPGGYGSPPDYGRGPPPPTDHQGDRSNPAAPPPPAGYGDQDRREDQSEQSQRDARAYAEAQERWATENCIRQAQDRAVAGTIIGGILGAVIGSNLGSGGGRTGGALIGGAAGALAGNALARDSGGGVCPQGYAVRVGAPVFVPPPYVVYAAPVEYNPWFWYGDRWVYRPYPYHRYYWRHHH
ncbi:MAG TPA: glycine zipper 2TM domain-containing protein [Caulobacteraceae bacterium]|nr:glycine zipper 2TM domain-containing protein [Caulobacteraceae bacterium]